MLNEISEYEQYSCKNPQENCTRLSSLNKALNGLNRAMVIVARYWMFNEENQADIAKAKQALEAWCGLTKNDEFNDISGWLIKFMGKENWEKYFKSKKEKDISKSCFNANLADSKTNDFRKITYDRVLADAFAAGPLKRYYLVCKKDFYEQAGLRFELDKNNAVKFNDINRKTNAKLKLTACYKLGGIFTQEEFKNWSPFNYRKPETFKFKGETICQKEEISDNLFKLTMQEEWESNFQIVSEPDFKEWHKKNPDWVFWSDNSNGSKNDFLIFNN